ncbi:hypothetical protein ACFC9N_11195 [Enterococcus casseliflavus]|uniref:hypothetical protein n=1 Tax=Enterococcus casseliflavus TaxID=37734 RepID=UPI0039A44590
MFAGIVIVWCLGIAYCSSVIGIKPTFWGQLRGMPGGADAVPLSITNALIMLVMNFAGAWVISDIGARLSDLNIPVISTVGGFFSALSFFYFGIPMIYLLMIIVVSYVKRKLS